MSTIAQFADAAALPYGAKADMAAEPTLATIATTATTALTCITAAFGHHDSERLDVMSTVEADASVDTMVAARRDALQG
ncbi:hypothetical protein [Micrococcus luteus]|uniref:hypothetical protein n=1 Tax=Micrococcus luteus TaxID=1270 RepID=UPI0010C814A3|nr:hypothetical protein [Micrococcus luteus]MCM3578483.1 hypothetical protein [Micrococcus luteus]MCV7531054.1 hypothetical protein [Micrococcus luteus]QCP08733.1 hypothetical protein FDF08_12780 [Micrococcus luteus]